MIRSDFVYNLDPAVKTIRAMAYGTLDSQVGARICNGPSPLAAKMRPRQFRSSSAAAK
jgi:hypothetical protein